MKQKAKRAASYAKYRAANRNKIAAAALARYHASPRTAEQRAAACARARAWYLANPERAKANRAKWRAANLEKAAALHRKWKAKNPDKKAANNRKWAAENPDKAAASVRKYKAANRAKIRAAERAYYAANRDKRAVYFREYYAANVEKLTARVRAYHAKNPGAHSALIARRRAERYQATPPWVNMSAIKAIYAEAAAKGLTVDHIVPLKGRTVSGLHVPWNLQLLTKSENSKKHNRFIS